MALKYPVYFALGLTEKANNYYKMFINWTNQKIRKTFIQRNMFDFKHIKPFDRGYIDNPGAMVKSVYLNLYVYKLLYVCCFRSFSLHLECFMLDCHYRSSRNGLYL